MIYAVNQVGHTVKMKVCWTYVPCRVCDDLVVDVRDGVWICRRCWHIMVDGVAALEEVEEERDAKVWAILGLNNNGERPV